jgi:hypothetical protein
MSTKYITVTIVSLALLAPVAALAHAPDYHSERDVVKVEQETLVRSDDGLLYRAAHPDATPAKPTISPSAQ